MDSYQKHCIKVVTKLSGCCIDGNRRIPAQGTHFHQGTAHGATHGIKSDGKGKNPDARFQSIDFFNFH
jgi:hypothetical protein